MKKALYEITIFSTYYNNWYKIGTMRGIAAARQAIKEQLAAYPDCRAYFVKI